MPPPNHSSTGTISDGGLTVLANDESKICIKVGGCSLGVAGTIYPFRGTDFSTVISTLGKGKAVDDLIGHLKRSKGKTTLFYKSATSTAGSNSAVTQSGAGPVVTVTGAPDDDYSVIVEILLGGIIGTSTFRYSLDGGDSYSGTLATAATHLLPNGVTLNMAAGTYVLGETYRFTCIAPAMTVGDVGTALDNCIASPYAWRFFHIVGCASTAANAATMAATLTTKIAAAHAVHRYIWGAMELPPVTAASIVTAFAAYTDRFLVVCGGYAEITADRSDLPTNLLPKRSSAMLIVPRIARNPLSVQALRNEADTKIEEVLPDGTKLVPAGNVSGDASGYYDENVTGTLNTARIAVLRRFDQRPGAFVENVPTMAGPTSDLQTVQELQVVLEAASQFYQFALDTLGARLRTKADGTIAESSAGALDDKGTEVMKAAMGGEVQDVLAIVHREDVIATTKKLRAEIRVKAWDHIYSFDWEIALTTNLVAA